MDDLLEVDRTCTSDTVEGQSSNLELYPRSDWQPVKSVTKHRGVMCSYLALIGYEAAILTTNYWYEPLAGHVTRCHHPGLTLGKTF